MSKKRKTKLIIIIALVILIASLSIGLATFSSVLTISSSATVTPNNENLKITIYGIGDKFAFDEQSGIESLDDLKDSGFLSNRLGYAIEENATSDVASIDNVTHTISNIKAYFGNQRGYVEYYFVIKNEGQYDAYLDLSNMVFDSENNKYILGNELLKTCTPGEGATLSLTEEACKSITGAFVFLDEYGIKKVDTNFKIPVGSSEVFIVAIDYSASFVDGPFDVAFDDFQFKFSTTNLTE